MADQASLLEHHYQQELDRLRVELQSQLPSDESQARQLVSASNHDASLTKFVVLQEATPKALAAWVAEDVSTRQPLVDSCLANTALLTQMLVADGAKRPAINVRNNNYGPAAWGQAFLLLQQIEQESDLARNEDSIYRRLAIAIALEHAVPLPQDNPQAVKDVADKFIDSLRRYLNYEMAYQEGELDPAFDTLTIWDLRFVVDGNEPDETLQWGRTMLQQYRPDHLLNSNYEWRYVGLVRTNVPYGSHRVKFDAPHQQQYQNILMNGGICGRRAFMGRFILRAFGIPTTARPSHAHGALCHWTPPSAAPQGGGGWVVNLGPHWGQGWTHTIYDRDMNFYHSTKARQNATQYIQVKRAQWYGDVMGEPRVYGEQFAKNQKPPDIRFWNGLSLQLQKEIIANLAHQPQQAARNAGGNNQNRPRSLAERVRDNPISPQQAKQIQVQQDGRIEIPAAGFTVTPGKPVKDVQVMPSFSGPAGSLQIYLPAFSPQGLTVLRGGTWKTDSPVTCSGARLLSGGYGHYHDWGFRVAMGQYGDDEQDGASCPAKEITLELEDSSSAAGKTVTLELVYISPGTFVMGGENTEDGRFKCVEVPAHQVTLTKGFYLGKYPVTQAQFQAVLGRNPSKSTKDPNCPVDNVSEDEALEFCTKVVDTIGKDVRLPSEAEWEYACRGGTDTKWFFGADPSPLGDYAWFKGNSGGKSHPVGQKKPNPFGLYDMYGNVWERVNDKYAKDYYAKSPPVDPTGPVQGTKSAFEYTVQAPQAGTYALSALVVTANHKQNLTMVVNQAEPVVMELPFTLGEFQESTPILVTLQAGENNIKFWRENPPQYGVAVRSFTLTPAPGGVVQCGQSISIHTPAETSPAATENSAGGAGQNANNGSDVYVPSIFRPGNSAGGATQRSVYAGRGRPPKNPVASGVSCTMAGEVSPKSQGRPPIHPDTSSKTRSPTRSERVAPQNKEEVPSTSPHTVPKQITTTTRGSSSSTTQPSPRRSIFDSFWKKHKRVSDETEAKQRDFGSDSPSVASTAASTQASVLPSPRHTRGPSYSSVPESPGSLSGKSSLDGSLNENSSFSLSIFSPPAEHKSVIMSRFESIDRLPSDLQLPPLPAPLNRVCRSDGALCGGGVYPLASPKSILHTSTYQNSPESLMKKHLKDETGEQFNKSGSVLSPSLRNGERRRKYANGSAMVMSMPMSLTDSMHIGANAAAQIRKDALSILQRDSSSSDDACSSNSSVSCGHRVHFDPRVTITEYNDRAPREWYGDDDLDKFKAETIALVQDYLLSHPDEIADYCTPTIDPVTGVMKKKTLYSIPVLNCLSDDDDSDTATSSPRASSRSKSKKKPVSSSDYAKIANIHVQKILIVDPNKLILDLFCKSLQQIFPRAEMIAVQTGEEALHQTKEAFRKGARLLQQQKIQGNVNNLLPRGFDIVIIEERLRSLPSRGYVQSPTPCPNRSSCYQPLQHRKSLSLPPRSLLQKQEPSSTSDMGDRETSTFSRLENFPPKFLSGSEVLTKIKEIEDEFCRPDRCILEEDEDDEVDDSPQLTTATCSSQNGSPSVRSDKQGSWRSLLIGVCLDQKNDTIKLWQSGADFVWGKPPPPMGVNLRNQLVGLLVRKRYPHLKTKSESKKQ